jgi:hypothetical protein
MSYYVVEFKSHENIKTNMSVSMHERWRGNLGPRHAICAALEREVATSRFAAEEYGNAR